jgi:membrane-associated HD superfamily phosphohydrolase
MNESVLVSTDTSLADQIAAKQQAIQEAKTALLSKTGHDYNGGWWSTNNAMTVSSEVLLFGLIVMLTLVQRIKKNDISDHQGRLFIIVLVVISSLFLVVVGYSDSQIAPVMGLLGTIVGYVLRGIANPESGPPNRQPEPPTPVNPTGPKGVQGP